MSYQLLKYEVSDAVAVITMNQPDNLNALGMDMSRELRGAVREAGADQSVRVIVVRGAGRAFSSGGNLREMSESIKADPGRYMDELTREVYGAVEAVMNSTKPVVASVQGLAYGAAMNLTLACDMVIAAKGAVFCESFIKLGLIPGGFATTLLTRSVGINRALEICLSAREITALEGERLGFVTRIVEPDQLQSETMKLAERLAKLPPIAVRETKRLFRAYFHNPPSEQSRLERETQIAMSGTADFAEAVNAFVEKRKPIFKGE